MFTPIEIDVSSYWLEMLRLKRTFRVLLLQSWVYKTNQLNLIRKLFILRSLKTIDERESHWFQSNEFALIECVIRSIWIDISAQNQKQNKNCSPHSSSARLAVCITAPRIEPNSMNCLCYVGNETIHRCGKKISPQAERTYTYTGTLFTYVWSLSIGLSGG